MHFKFNSSTSQLVQVHILHHMSFFYFFSFQKRVLWLNLHSMIITIGFLSFNGFHPWYVVVVDRVMKIPWVELSLAFLYIFRVDLKIRSTLQLMCGSSWKFNKASWVDSKTRSTPNTYVGTAVECAWMMARTAQSCCNLGPKT